MLDTDRLYNIRLLCPDEALAADPNAPVPGFVQIAQLVIFEGNYILRYITLFNVFSAFLWGMGTAIGELPPYFVARAGKLYLFAEQALMTAQQLD